MTKNLIPFLQEVSDRVSPYLASISFVHMKPQSDGRLLAAAIANDGTVVSNSTSKEQIDIENARVCLGNLPYLIRLMKSSLIGSDTEIEITSKTRNEKKIVNSIQFNPNGRSEITYLATDPFRASMVKPINIEVNDWPVAFIVDNAGLAEIAELQRIHAAAPTNGGTGKDDVVAITHNNEEITLDFGEGGISHSSTLVLDTEVVSETTNIVSLNIGTNLFMTALKQSKDSDGFIEIHMSEKAVKLAVETPVAEHELVLVRRVQRDD